MMMYPMTNMRYQSVCVLELCITVRICTTALFFSFNEESLHCFAEAVFWGALAHFRRLGGEAKPA